MAGFCVNEWSTLPRSVAETPQARATHLPKWERFEQLPSIRPRKKTYHLVHADMSRSAHCGYRFKGVRSPVRRLIYKNLPIRGALKNSFPAYRSYPVGSMARVDGLAVDAFIPIAGDARSCEPQNG